MGVAFCHVDSAGVAFSPPLMMVKQTMGRPRLCLLTEAFFPVFGGGENQARLLTGELVRQGARVFIITRRSDRKLQSRELIDGIAIYRVGPPGFVRYGKYLMMLPAFIRLVAMRKEYDVIYVCGFRTLGTVAVAAGRLLHKAVVLKAESEGELSGRFIFEDARVSRSCFLSLFVKPILDLRVAILRQTDVFISISPQVKEEFLRHQIREAAIQTIPNGMDMENFAPINSEDKQRLRLQLGIPADRFVVGYSGKLNRYKGLELLLKVWKRVALAHPHAYLLLIGSGEGQYLSCEAALRAFVAEENLSGMVGFAGFVSNMPEYLQVLDAYAFPSEREGFPLGPFEAMACGLPVVATKVGAIPDVIDGRTNGLLMDATDEQALFQALDRLIANPEEAGRLGAQARKAIEQFHINRIANRYISVFESVLRNGSGAQPAN